VATRLVLAALLLALLSCLTAGCAPPARSARPAAEPSRWADHDAIAALRARLRARGYGPAITAGPMVALWDELAPASPLAFEPAIPRATRRGGPGAWLVVTEAGSWWVWEETDQGPLREQPVLLY
jgi:hypothetical protein